MLWVIVAAIGLRPGALRLRRRLERAGPAMLLCGACGHPATSLGSIETCPECGKAYTAVGLDGAATAARWAPPVFVLGLVLLGSWLLGSIALAPMAARWANRKAIGAPMVSSDRMIKALAPAGSGAGPHARPPLAIEIDATLVRPLDPGTSLVPPPLPGSTITVRAAAGPAVAGAEPIWSAASAQSPYAVYPGLRIHASMLPYGHAASARGAPPRTPAPLASPWDAMLAAAGPHELTLDPVASRWTLRDPTGATIERGSGVESASLALLGAIGVTPASWPDAVAAEGARLALSTVLADPTDTISIVTAVAGGPGTPAYSPAELAMRRAAIDYVSIPPLAERTRVATLHPAAPIGLTAAIATSASLLLVAVLLFALSWRTTRRSITART